MATATATANAILILILLTIFFTCDASHSVPCAPKGAPSAPPKATAKCPRDTLKFGICGDWFGLVHEVVGAKPSKECCALLEGLADVEAALCLCTAIKANVLGIINVEMPVALSLGVNSCGKKVPDGFVCS